MFFHMTDVSNLSLGSADTKIGGTLEPGFGAKLDVISGINAKLNSNATDNISKAFEQHLIGLPEGLKPLAGIQFVEELSKVNQMIQQTKSLTNALQKQVMQSASSTLGIKS